MRRIGEMVLGLSLAIPGNVGAGKWYAFCRDKMIPSTVVRYLFLAILGATGIAASGQGSGLSTEDQVLAQRIAADADPDLYQQGKGSAAEFISNRFYTLRSARWTVRDRKERNNIPYPNAVKHLAEFHRLLEEGKNWKVQSPPVCIPFFRVPPVPDGLISEAEWAEALKFAGEYRIGDSAPDSERCDSRWLAGRYENDLYIGAEFSDEDLHPLSGTSFDEPEPIYQGDCLEIFIRPDVEALYYREYLVNPQGKHWSLHHKASPFGQWDVLNPAADDSIAVGCTTTSRGFRIEVKIPLDVPEAKCWSLIMVRCNRDKAGSFHYSTPVPLLYDPHNIYGYMRVAPAPKR